MGRGEQIDDFLLNSERWERSVSPGVPVFLTNPIAIQGVVFWGESYEGQTAFALPAVDTAACFLPDLTHCDLSKVGRYICGGVTKKARGSKLQYSFNLAGISIFQRLMGIPGWSFCKWGKKGRTVGWWLEWEGGVGWGWTASPRFPKLAEPLIMFGWGCGLQNNLPKPWMGACALCLADPCPS